MASLFSKSDREKWHAGNHHHTYEKMGAHLTEDGVRFAVWAPHAHSVSVVGQFNNWDGRENPMQKDEETGIWSTEVKGLEHWALYKYELKTGPESPPFLKADPYAFYSELRPKNASIVYELDGFEWEDEEWVSNRADNHRFDRPMSIYEVHIGSWRLKGWQNNEYLSYRELADELIPYVSEMGFTHIELMPISEFPYDPSWGYQVTGYYAPTSRYGEPKDFMHFVNECHKAGIGIILDWVPGHFPKDDQALQMFDGQALYEHEHPFRREQKDWGTHVFDYGKPGVRNFLISNAAYWCDKFHIDGIRVDAVASMLYLDYSKAHGEWLPNRYGGNENIEAIEFLKEFNRVMKDEYPGVLTIAEESTSWAGVTDSPDNGGLGFDYKWNMGWMNDTLSYMEMNVKGRYHNPRKITFPMVYAMHEHFVLPLSHDEVVHLKKPLAYKSPGDHEEQFANLRLLFSYMFGHPGKKLLFMGGEFAQTSEWSEDRQMDWHLLNYKPHQGMQRLVSDLLDMYKEEFALFERENDYNSFEWVHLGNEHPALFSFLRKAGDPGNHLFFILNFSDQEVFDYSPGPFEGTQYELLINTDSEYYGGENRGSLSEPVDGYRQKSGVAPFSALILKSIY